MQAQQGIISATGPTRLCGLLPQQEPREDPGQANMGLTGPGTQREPMAFQDQWVQEVHMSVKDHKVTLVCCYFIPRLLSIWSKCSM